MSQAPDGPHLHPPVYHFGEGFPERGDFTAVIRQHSRRSAADHSQIMRGPAHEGDRTDYRDPLVGSLCVGCALGQEQVSAFQARVDQSDGFEVVRAIICEEGGEEGCKGMPPVPASHQRIAV